MGKPLKVDSSPFLVQILFSINIHYLQFYSILFLGLYRQIMVSDALAATCT